MTSIHLPARTEPRSEVVDFEAKQVLFFDGECAMCNGSVKWIFARDQDDRLAFAALQGEAADEYRARHSDFPTTLDTFVLVDDGVVYTRSTAALRVASYLGFPWNMSVVFRLVPRFLRDAVYDFVAKRRFDWFGKVESCWLPPAHASHRFLE